MSQDYPSLFLNLFLSGDKETLKNLILNPEAKGRKFSVWKEILKAKNVDFLEWTQNELHLPISSKTREKELRYLLTQQHFEKILECFLKIKPQTNEKPWNEMKSSSLVLIINQCFERKKDLDILKKITDDYLENGGFFIQNEEHQNHPLYYAMQKKSPEILTIILNAYQKANMTIPIESMIAPAKEGAFEELIEVLPKPFIEEHWGLIFKTILKQGSVSQFLWAKNYFKDYPHFSQNFEEEVIQNLSRKSGTIIKAMVDALVEYNPKKEMLIKIIDFLLVKDSSEGFQGFSYAFNIYLEKGELIKENWQDKIIQCSLISSFSEELRYKMESFFPDKINNNLKNRSFPFILNSGSLFYLEKWIHFNPEQPLGAWNDWSQLSLKTKESNKENFFLQESLKAMKNKGWNMKPFDSPITLSLLFKRSISQWIDLLNPLIEAGMNINGGMTKKSVQYKHLGFYPDGIIGLINEIRWWGYETDKEKIFETILNLPSIELPTAEGLFQISLTNPAFYEAIVVFGEREKLNLSLKDIPNNPHKSIKKIRI